ncbi:flagellar hook assembly protein FlgD [Enterovirga rhinocerotis]|uniref:Basal-body rod modification protein FlgD n=1 Tax=Enterovirga rhinocerotis TaxID=1339210 RepID=A0A4R7BX77_9HYPH|nr:flagellar hook capping FlgD N-terminal domain-containing protein [Enterovirga rhinocerotis]TDR90113.1 flagellar basal-body rod modification protein FlgD [Enterovirga rhinocerotis]
MATVNLAGAVGFTPSSASTASSGNNEIAGNFQQFLLLLTTQLKNQSPLDPLDTNQFTQQLVQFASVEQQLKTNSTLSSLVEASKASTASTAAGLVGATVTVDGSQATFTGGAASWSIDAAKASTATITIKDSTGMTVATQTRALAAGSQTFTWDGRALNGNTVTAGNFTVSVTARDASGQNVKVSTDLKGRVGSVDMTGTSPLVLIGDRAFSLNALKAIGG